MRGRGHGGGGPSASSLALSLCRKEFGVKTKKTQLSGLCVVVGKWGGDSQQEQQRQQQEQQQQQQQQQPQKQQQQQRGGGARCPAAGVHFCIRGVTQPTETSRGRRLYTPSQQQQLQLAAAAAMRRGEEDAGRRVYGRSSGGGGGGPNSKQGGSSNSSSSNSSSTSSSSSSNAKANPGRRRSGASGQQQRQQQQRCQKSPSISGAATTPAAAATAGGGLAGGAPIFASSPSQGFSASHKGWAPPVPQPQQEPQPQQQQQQRSHVPHSAPQPGESLCVGSLSLSLFVPARTSCVSLSTRGSHSVPSACLCLRLSAPNYRRLLLSAIVLLNLFLVSLPRPVCLTLSVAIWFELWRQGLRVRELRVGRAIRTPQGGDRRYHNRGGRRPGLPVAAPSAAVAAAAAGATAAEMSQQQQQQQSVRRRGWERPGPQQHSSESPASFLAVAAAAAAEARVEADAAAAAATGAEAAAAAAAESAAAEVGGGGCLVSNSEGEQPYRVDGGPSSSSEGGGALPEESWDSPFLGPPLLDAALLGPPPALRVPPRAPRFPPSAPLEVGALRGPLRPSPELRREAHVQRLLLQLCQDDASRFEEEQQQEHQQQRRQQQQQQHAGGVDSSSRWGACGVPEVVQGRYHSLLLLDSEESLERQRLLQQQQQQLPCLSLPFGYPTLSFKALCLDDPHAYVLRVVASFPISSFDLVKVRLLLSLRSSTEHAKHAAALLPFHLSAHILRQKSGSLLSLSFSEGPHVSLRFWPTAAVCLSRLASMQQRLPPTPSFFPPPLISDKLNLSLYHNLRRLQCLVGLQSLLPTPTSCLCVRPSRLRTSPAVSLSSAPPLGPLAPLGAPPRLRLYRLQLPRGPQGQQQLRAPACLYLGS
ncbi:hypothetical protein Esti_001352 [Eimeria stiedai]